MTTEEAPSDNRPQISDNEVIERFGGIRPMAAKLGVAVTTVQGWKERGHIPSGRWRQIVESATTHGIDLGTGAAASAPAATAQGLAAPPQEDNAAPQHSEPPARPSGKMDAGGTPLPRAGDGQGASAEAPATKQTAPQPVPSDSDAKHATSRPGVAWLALVLTLAFGVALLTRPYWESALYRGGSGGPDPALANRIEADLDAVQRTVARLDREVSDRSASLAGRISALEAGGGEAGAEFAGQLADLDAQMAELSKSLDTVSSAMDRIARRMATLESAQDQLSEPVQREFAKVTERLGRLQSSLEEQQGDMEAGLGDIEKSIGGLESRITDLETRPIQTGEKIAALALAVGQLEAALDSGKPYRPALDRLHALGGDDPVIAESRALAVLEPWADHGIPDRLALYQRYVAITPAIARALAATEEETWLDIVWNNLKGLVTIRRIDGDGELSPVSQAEIAMDRGDLSAAVAALDGSGSLGPEGDAWLVLVKARIEAEREIETLYGQVIAPLANSAGVETESR